MRPCIHFHSDMSFFAGCENMLANFFNDNSFMSQYDVSFSYRYSTEYDQGFKARVPRVVKTYPLGLLDAGWLNILANGRVAKPLAIVLKVIAQLLKYIYIVCNTAVLYIVFRTHKIGLLHINNGGYPGAYSCMSAVFAAKLAGIREIVYIVNNEVFSYQRPGRWFDYFFDKMVGKYVTVFVTGSIHAGQALKKVLGLPPEKIRNIKNGILLRTATENREEFFKRFGLEQDRLLIGVVAILEERKGHMYLLQALKSLKDSGRVNKMPHVIIEGEGPLLDDLQAYVMKARLSDCVKFIGVEKNICNLMKAMDLLVLPSVSGEDFPNVILEAMGFGKPVVASNICGIPEQVENMKSGILVKPADASGLAQAIGRFLDDRSLLAPFGDRARQIFTEKFQAATAVANYSNLYQTLLLPLA